MPLKDLEARRIYMRLYRRRYYPANREYVQNRAKKYRVQRWERNTAHIANYLADHHCVDCGEKDPIVLEFDHRGDVPKEYGISQMLRNHTVAKLAAEISKCDVRCANCHRRRTAVQIGWTNKLMVAVAQSGER